MPNKKEICRCCHEVIDENNERISETYCTKCYPSVMYHMRKLNETISKLNNQLNDIERQLRER
jgi:hypothetical protein